MPVRKNSTAYSAQGFPFEKLDCSVRALAVASDMPYADAHALFKQAGRKDKRGTPTQVSVRVHAGLGYEKLALYRDAPGIIAVFPTLAQFIRTHRRGRFILHRRGHAFALINGVVHDWSNGTGARSRIKVAWRVT